MRALVVFGVLALAMVVFATEKPARSISENDIDGPVHKPHHRKPHHHKKPHHHHEKPDHESGSSEPADVISDEVSDQVSAEPQPDVSSEEHSHSSEEPAKPVHEKPAHESSKNYTLLDLFVRSLYNDKDLPPLDKIDLSKHQRKVVDHFKKAFEGKHGPLKGFSKFFKHIGSLKELREGKYSDSYDVAQRFGDHGALQFALFKKAFKQAARLGSAYRKHPTRALKQGKHFANQLDKLAAHFVQRVDAIVDIVSNAYEVRLALNSLSAYLRAPHPYEFVYFEKNITEQALAGFYLKNHTDYVANFTQLHEHEPKHGGYLPTKQALLLKLWQQTEMLAEYRAVAPLAYAFYLGHENRLTDYYITASQEKFVEVYFGSSTSLSDLLNHGEKPHDEDFDNSD